MSLSLRRATRPAAVVGSLLAVLAIACAPAGAHSQSHAGTGFGATTLKLDPAAVSALTSLGVTPAPIAPARATRSGDLAFPITNSFADALRTGVIHHSGGISLTAGSTTVALTDFDIDVRAGQLSALVGGARVAILDLDFSAARVAFRHGGVRVGPVGAKLTQAAADALNGAFGLPAGTVPAGLKLGDATVHSRLSHHH